MIGLVVFLVIVYLPLGLLHSSERIVLLGDGVVEVGLQGAVFFEEVLVDLLKRFFLGNYPTSVGLEMVVVVVAD